ncbi:MAG: anti-sigma factor antagonist [Pseudonocardiaceae bacterium]
MRRRDRTGDDRERPGAEAPVADLAATPSKTTAPDGDGLAGDLALSTPGQLGLTVQLPTVGTRVVAVDGELDALTVPLLEACVREQLAAAPAHLILDLQPVSFLGSSGLNCLLHARELAEQTTGTQLHLAGLVTRVVARPLQVTGLAVRFDTYPTLTEALATLAQVRITTRQVDLLSVTGRLDDTGLTELHSESQALCDRGTRYLVVDLARVTRCDHRLFDVLARTHQTLAARGGWMRLVGVNHAVRNALDQALSSEVLLVDQAADWTSDLTG